MADPGARGRLDKWLWHARFFKSRSLATAQVAAGHLRVNGAKVARPARAVGPGDVLTFMQGRRVRIVRIVAIATRRGPAAEAQTLYEDLSPAPEASETPAAHPAAARSGRPTGRERRHAARATRDALD